MAEFGLGITPQGLEPVVMFTNPSRSAPPVPQAWESWFETPEGIRIKATVNTPNRVYADQVEVDMAKALGWKILDAVKIQAEEADKPKTLGERIAVCWGLSCLVAIMAGFVTFMSSIVWASVHDWPVQRSDNFISHIPPWAILAFITCGLVATAQILLEAVWADRKK